MHDISDTNRHTGLRWGEFANVDPFTHPFQDMPKAVYSRPRLLQVTGECLAALYEYWWQNEAMFWGSNSSTATALL